MLFGDAGGRSQTLVGAFFKKSWVASRRRVGCGTGDKALECAAASIRTYAVDGSAEMCRAAREKAPRGT